MQKWSEEARILWCAEALYAPRKMGGKTMSTSQEKKLPSNRTYTVDDIAAILGIAKSTAYRLVNSGEFKTIRIGYAIRISRKSFEDWLAMEEPEGETE